MIAESFERIHRSNLVGMGILPLQYQQGDTATSLGLTGRETFSIDQGLNDSIKPLQELTVTACRGDGTTVKIPCVCRIDTPVEIEYYRNGGILHTVIRNMLKG